MTLTEDHKEINATVDNFLSLFHQRVGHSKTLHSMGVNDEFSSYVHDVFSNPLKALIDSNTTQLNGIKKSMQKLFDRFLKSSNENIIKAFGMEQENNLVYYVCLKEDTAETREPYFEFLDFYEELGVNTKLPLYIKFVPEEFLDRVTLKEIEVK